MKISRFLFSHAGFLTAIFGTFLFFGTVTPSAFAVANFLGNPSFESAIGNGNDAGNWDSTNNAETVTNATRPAGFSVVPDGTNALEVEAGEFTFQLSTNIQPGDDVQFSGRVETNIPAGAVGQGAHLKIEFKNSSDVVIDDEVSTDITTTNANAGAGYQTFTITATAPVGTAKVTFVLDAPDFTGPAPGTRFAVFDQMTAFVTTAAAAAGATSGTGVSASNVLGNPGIEIPIGSGTNSNWDSTNGAARADNTTLNAAGFANAPEGTHAMIVESSEFTFQTITKDVAEGDTVTFSAYAQSTIFGLTNGGRLKIEFRNIQGSTNVLLDNSSVSARMNVASAPADTGNNYVYFEARGKAPAGTNTVVFVVETSSVGGSIAIDNFNATVNPVGFNIAASATTVQPGGALTIMARFTNTSTVQLTNVEFVADFPDGFNVIRNSIRRDDGPTEIRQGSIIVPIGTVNGSQNVSVSFVMLATTGISTGKTYTLRIVFRDSTGRLLSRDIQVLVEDDPLFDQGTIIGKVFNDLNQNGIQDGCKEKGKKECPEAEQGVPWVRLITEEGIIVITDEFGRYHLPAVKPGRHLVKIDGHTLPDGTKFITEESYLVKITPGIMAKANFAVLLPPSGIPAEFQKDLNVRVTQGLDTSPPVLQVKMEPELLKLGVGVLERQAVIKMGLNYPDFVKTWALEVRDEMGRSVWSGFGVGAPPAEVVWSGQTDNGVMIKPGIYSYQFKVEDGQGRQDWTPLYFFRVVSKLDSLLEEDRYVEIPPVGDFNIFKDGKRSIPLVAKPTLQIKGKTKPGYKVKVNGYDLPVNQEGLFQTEFYTSPGDKEIKIAATSPEGETINYAEKVKVKDSMFFAVALGEEQLGVNFQDGDLETAGMEDEYKKGFYENGRLSYYLRGKLKGKFLFKSHYDTDDERSALFTNLDPDKYYPIYGDGSTRDYEAVDTKSRLFVIVEMDRSFAKFGSFKTNFTDNELASYNRTMSGFDLNYETLASTVYGDPKRGFKVFGAAAGHKAAHDEFLGTGGTLYYLRNRQVIQGSEKIRVEIHDKIQDMTVDSYDLVEGQDYEIDYDSGRIMLSRPLSSIAASDTFISQDILNGNSVFLVVDYEYDAGLNAFADKNSGLRGFTHMGNHIKVGATAVTENRQGADYDLRGVDMTVKLGRNTQVKTEYAETTQKQVLQGISYNGGLSFADLGQLRGPQTRPRESAFLIKGESKPVKNLDVSTYLQGVDAGFSNDHIRAHEGTRKYGIATRYKFTEDFYIRHRYDASDLENEILPLTESGIAAPYQRFRGNTMQAVYDNKKILFETEYKHQQFDFPQGENLIPTLFSEAPFENGLGAKLGYHLNERFLPYIKAQAGFFTKPNNQFGAGLRYRVRNSLYAYVEQMVGNLGDSTLFGLERLRPNGVRSYANLRTLDQGLGTRSLASSIGNSFGLTEKSRVYSERMHSSYQSLDGYSNILGYEGKSDDRWDYDLRLERRRLSQASTRLLDQQAQASLTRANSYNSAYGALAYSDGKKLKTRSSLEFRLDADSPKLRQWLTRNYLEYKINQDLSYLGKLDFGKSIFLDPDDHAANFMEFSTGFAFRPVENDRLNILTRYSFLLNGGTDVQFSSPLFNGVETEDRAHIISVDVAYDIWKHLGLVQKFAYKNSILNTNITNEIILHTFLYVTRLNFHVTKKWDISGEYRILGQMDALDTLKHGPLAEVDREIYDYVRLGVGYNFTDFSDDLRSSSNYNSHGPFVRMTGKF